MAFLEKDLPAIIQYDPETKPYYIKSMAEIDWALSPFTVLQTNATEEDYQHLMDSIIEKERIKSIPPLSQDHWMHAEVKKDILSLAPLKYISVSQSVKDTVVEALRQAFRWSLRPNQPNTIDPTAVVLNGFHQLFGYPLDPDVLPEKDLILTEETENQITLNRYVFDYYGQDGKLKSYMVRAPNAVLACFQFQQECKTDFICLSKATPITFEEENKGFTYAVRYRLRHESVMRLCYYTTDKALVDETHLEFMNKYPEAVILKIKQVVEDNDL